MYHSNGNFEAFAQAIKPEGADKKKAYFVGSGLASLAGAAFLIRDAGVPGKNITVFEELALPGGSMDGILDEHKGFIIRGGREMEAHFETLWDLFRSVPSLAKPGVSVLDEMYELHKSDPSSNPMRATYERGKAVPSMGELTLTPKAVQEIIDLALTPESQLDDKRIDEYFTQEFFDSNFWLYWATMFAFEPWASALEMRRYLLRFIHHVATLPDLTSLRFTHYNQYESLIVPLVKHLESEGVTFQYDTQVEDIGLDLSGGKKVATSLELTVGGEKKTIDLTTDDLVFVTNGSITESSTFGDNDHPAPIETDHGGAWKLWKTLAAKDPSLGHPEKFCENIPSDNWVISGTITLTDDKIWPYIQKLTGRDPRNGKIVTGGPCNFKDSGWFYGFTMSRQPHFEKQDPNKELVLWVYGLFSDRPGDYVKKPIKEATGIELTEELLYHLGVPVEEIPDLARNSASTVPCHMPYITSYFMPRAAGDRPLVVPEGSTNLAFIGNFAETPIDTVFTTEYSVRTAMEAVYTLLDVNRGVPEVFGSQYDIRVLLSALYYLNDKKKLADVKLPLMTKVVGAAALHKVKGTYVEELLKDAGLI
ncbi:oleate hydratase [Branchiibius hedensis]|uniref:Oleate hydratase n=1 Tax=Branchiibius hedensis TaxID=672460 RepID=A0A2Y8ZTN7_9MICO|nr:oleate hydratase [Branchiibius hedensis]PWJ25815.1 oleate hydratase [Branchiibius hedensis]SSA34628.1 oleate hydratase [Branchiibius hedensis]